MAGIDIISDSTGKEIVAAIQSTDVAQARILEINTAAEAKKNEVLESIPEDYSNISKEVDELKGDITENRDDIKTLNNVKKVNDILADASLGYVNPEDLNARKDGNNIIVTVAKGHGYGFNIPMKLKHEYILSLLEILCRIKTYLLSYGRVL